MPELLTRYPDVALKILKEAGIQCGTGKKQQILRTCPPDRFCQLPTGELCIYGLEDVASMTQIHKKTLLEKGVELDGYGYTLIVLGVVFLVGILLGRFLK